MFFVRRMFSKTVTQEYLVEKMNEILKPYSKPPYNFEVPHQEIGLNDLQMAEVIVLLEMSTGIWLDDKKVESLMTIDQVIKLALETAENNSSKTNEV